MRHERLVSISSDEEKQAKYFLDREEWWMVDVALRTSS
jgi:hypothetical protein